MSIVNSISKVIKDTFNKTTSIHISDASNINTSKIVNLISNFDNYSQNETVEVLDMPVVGSKEEISTGSGIATMDSDYTVQ